MASKKTTDTKKKPQIATTSGGKKNKRPIKDVNQQQEEEEDDDDEMLDDSAEEDGDSADNNSDAGNKDDASENSDEDQSEDEQDGEASKKKKKSNDGKAKPSNKRSKKNTKKAGKEDEDDEEIEEDDEPEIAPPKIVIHIEGNIGSGKSSLLKKFGTGLTYRQANENFPDYFCVNQEPLDGIFDKPHFMNLSHDDDALFAFMVHAMSRMTDQINCALFWMSQGDANNPTMILMERSMKAQMDMFATANMVGGRLPTYKFDILNEIKANSEYYHLDDRSIVHRYIMIDVPLKTCLQRIEGRSRNGEKYLGANYLTVLEDLCKDMMVETKGVVFKPDPEKSVEEIFPQFRQIVSRVYTDAKNEYYETKGKGRKRTDEIINTAMKKSYKLRNAIEDLEKVKDEAFKRASCMRKDYIKMLSAVYREIDTEEEIIQFELKI